jgi:hypothetical protein
MAGGNGSGLGGWQNQPPGGLMEPCVAELKALELKLPSVATHSLVEVGVPTVTYVSQGSVGDKESALASGGMSEPSGS